MMEPIRTGGPAQVAEAGTSVPPLPAAEAPWALTTDHADVQDRRGKVPIASSLSLSAKNGQADDTLRIGLPQTFFQYRQTAFDQDVLMARFLHDRGSGFGTSKRILDLLQAAGDDAVGHRRLDQVEWLAKAFDGEFNDLPGAMFRSQRLNLEAQRLLASGDFTLSPYWYPDFDYGPFPGRSAPPPAGDPFDRPVERERQTRDTEQYRRMMTRTRGHDWGL